MRLLSFSVVACGALALLAPRMLSAEDKSVDELLAEARLAFERGESQQALEIADRAVANDPKNPRAVFVRGLFHESLNDHRRAIDDFDRTLKLSVDRERVGRENRDSVFPAHSTNVLLN